jgi:hypothetical protein
MKKIIMTLAALALAATAANAEPILNGYVGPITIKYIGFENLVTSVGQTLSGYYRVTEIDNANTLMPIWTPTATSQITGVFNGLTASSITAVPGGFTIDFTAGSTALYLNTTNSFVASNAASAALGTQILGVNFVPGIDPSDPTATFQADLKALTGFVNGSGTGYGAVVANSGILATELDSNKYLGGTADLYFTATLTDQSGNNPVNPLYPVLESDPVSGAAVPEPGTLALLGAGMLGLIGFKRRKA